MTENLRGMIGEGLTLLGGALHDIIKPFYKFVYSDEVKRIARHIFMMEAPLVVTCTYLFTLHGDWNYLRKDNAFVRTNPLSTQVPFLSPHIP